MVYSEPHPGQDTERKECIILDIKKLTDRWGYHVAISLKFSHGRPTLNFEEVDTISSNSYIFFLRIKKLKMGECRPIQRCTSSPNKAETQTR